ncbi:MAG: alanyl-tRNA editing protein [Oscillospiraceae bacterium]|nr:alanyl-tRNA editing protein [Oscillospiraceae bacterium]
MLPTKRLFDENPYLEKFEATVLFCEETENGFGVVLDSTAFFPEGGGQFPDEGTLNGEKVLDVQEDKKGVIRHLVQKAFSAEEKILGQIDMARRFDFMQQHSGEHIFSGLAHSKYGATNVGFHLGLAETTIDLDIPLSEEQVLELELCANEAVYKNLPIKITYPTAEELEALPYRSKKKLSGKIRIVTVLGYDICACCGTHVKNTGEIGIIKITSFQNYKGGTRLFMLCGKRAFLDYQAKNLNVIRVTNGLSVPPEEICFAVKRLENEITEHKIYESSLKKELFALKAEKLGTGERICVFEKDLTPDELRRYCLTLAENFKIAGVFCGENGNYKYAVASKTENCSAFAKEMNAKLCGRGGGKPELIQGGCSTAEQEIKDFFNNL